ncbi:hypothetical protein AHiyo1_13210 [Arthrobacter sp. Hiyo1]|nr:hypothetical protein AHiyo1_13210 [Arthrobacter sp. Hiyo1]
MLEQVQDHGDGDVVRQVGHESRRLNRKFGDLHGVGEDQVEFVHGFRAPRAHRFRQLAGQYGIDLDGDNCLGGVEQAERQRTQPGADLQHGFLGINTGGGDDPPDRVAVDDEVLAQGLCGADTDFLGERRMSAAPRRGATAAGSEFGSVT